MTPAAGPVYPVHPVYTVAGNTVVSDRPIPALDALRSDGPPGIAIRRRPVEIPPEARTVFAGTARVGTRGCQVRSLAAPGVDLLEISGAGLFAVRQDGIEVDPEPAADEAAVDEALLGPALAVALARRGVFVLHASAVATDRGVAGFLGESGAGKSTLARLLSQAGPARAADDLLAIGPDAAALPHFPQLKLDPAAMAAIAGLAPSHPLLALCVLEPAPPASAVRGEVLPPAGAAAELLRHTIAGSLFAPDLLTDHLGFAAALAGRVPVHRLAVPRRLDVGAEVLRYLFP
jgi:hypothetical protein